MDLELVRQAQRGDTAAYEELARSLAPRLFRVAFRIVRDADVAQDAMQQALIAIWRDLPTLRDLEAFEAWTWRLITTAATTEIRRDHRRTGSIRVVGLDDETNETGSTGRTADHLRALPSTGDASGALGDRDAIERAFAELTPEQRTVVVLRYYVGLSLEEIAQAIRIPYGTAASRMHYAMRALRAAMDATDRTSTEVQTA